MKVKEREKVLRWIFIILIILVIVIFLLVYFQKINFSGKSFLELFSDSNTISLDLDFSEPQITQSAYSPEYSHIEIVGAPSFGKVGEPVLPINGLKILIPENANVKDIEIVLGQKVKLKGEYLIEPGQQQYPLSKIKDLNITKDKPKPEIYNSDFIYPSKLSKYNSLQKKLGYNIAIAEVYPVEYNPAKKEISYYKKITVKVIYEKDTSETKDKFTPKIRTDEKTKKSDREIISSFIDNKQDLESYDSPSISGAAITGFAPKNRNPPSAPSSLTASIISSNQINLAWIDNSNNEEGFKIERSLNVERNVNENTFIEIARVKRNINSYSDIGLDESTNYLYRVSSYSSYGDSEYSNIALATSQGSGGGGVGGGYIIITSEAFVDSFEPLKQKKIQNGMDATIVTTEWIYLNYPGTDQQTQIRNFIIYAYNNLGTSYVLLGGDGDGADVGGESGDNIVPARGLSDRTHPTEIDNNIPADLYYSCLDGDFDYNKNGIYGESTDGVGGGEIDLLAEVYVGRAPVDSVAEADNFVRKTLAYENTQDYYLTNNYMIGEYLGFGGVSQYATNSLEEIRLGSSAHGYTTQGFLNPNKALESKTLYDSLGYTWTTEEMKDIINNGVHILNHLGHANVNLDMGMYNDDTHTLVNTKYFIGYSQGCYPGSFDNRGTNNAYTSYDCIIEHLIGNPTGAAAFVGNSRFGWGTLNSTAGSSQYYARQFWDALFGEGISEIGRMNQDSKEDNIPYLSWQMNRWVYFDLNLFGDPALEIHVPNSPILDASNSVFTEKIGNGDGLYDLGETWELVVSLQAYNKDIINTRAMISVQNPYITIQQGSYDYGTITNGQIKSNSASPFKFAISPNCPTCPLSHNFELELFLFSDDVNTSASFLINTKDYTKGITNNLQSSEYTPAIDGNIIVWMDKRNNVQGDIFMYDLATNTERVIGALAGIQDNPDVSGNKIVWEDRRDGRHIYMYDLATNTEKQITNNPIGQNSPAIDGNRIVYVENDDIYMYDLATNTERVITNALGYQQFPDISGDKIVWEDSRNGKKDIYMYDLATNTEKQITTDGANQFSPAIDGNIIVWVDERDGPYYVYMYDLATNTEKQITPNKAHQFSPAPAIGGNIIVWRDNRNGNDDIYMYDLATNTEKQVTTEGSNQFTVSIDSNKIVWVDGRGGTRNIYMYDLDAIITPPKTIPIAPSDLSASAISKIEIDLSWQDNSNNEQGFKIERSTRKTSGFKQIATVKTNVNFYRKIEVYPGKTYYYRVRAYNSYGDSAYSNTASLVTTRK